MERNESEEVNVQRHSDRIALVALWNIFFAASSDWLLVRAFMEMTVRSLGLLRSSEVC